MNNLENLNIVVGLTTWDSKPSRKYEREELPRLPYLRLVGGNNIIRIVSPIAAYVQARVKDLPKSKSKFGERLRVSFPTYRPCPIVDGLGIIPRERYIVLVIDRKDNELKLFDMSSIVKESIISALADKNDGRSDEDTPITANDFDINVRFDPKSKTPSGFYAVIARDVKALSTKENELLAQFPPELMEKILIRQTVSPKPETVLKRLEELGWTPNLKVAGDVEEDAVPAEPVSGNGELEAPTADDMDFSRA